MKYVRLSKTYGEDRVRAISPNIEAIPIHKGIDTTIDIGAADTYYMYLKDANKMIFFGEINMVLDLDKMDLDCPITVGREYRIPHSDYNEYIQEVYMGTLINGCRLTAKCGYGAVGKALSGQTLNRLIKAIS